MASLFAGGFLFIVVSDLSVLDLFQLTLAMTVGEIGQVVIAGSNLEQPFSSHLDTCSDIITCGQHEFVVQDPFRFVI